MVGGLRLVIFPGHGPAQVSQNAVHRSENPAARDPHGQPVAAIEAEPDAGAAGHAAQAGPLLDLAGEHEGPDLLGGLPGRCTSTRTTGCGSMR